jgi:hypothetical protein
MRSYIGFNDEGKILFASKGSPPTAEDLGPATGFMEFSGEWRNSYVQDGEVVPMGEPPSEHHVFDYGTKTYIDPRFSGGGQLTDEARSELWISVRAMRDGRLSACDWTVIPDSPFTAEQRSSWQTYRQELRDLPSEYAHVTSIEDVVFPEPPA